MSAPGVPEEARTDEIPDEAIEAAAQALASQAAMVTQSFAEMPEYLRDGYRRAATAAVTAAAPFLTAAARASGAVEGAAAERQKIAAEIERCFDPNAIGAWTEGMAAASQIARGSHAAADAYHLSTRREESASGPSWLRGPVVAARGGRAEGETT